MIQFKVCFLHVLHYRFGLNVIKLWSITFVPILSKTCNESVTFNKYSILIGQCWSTSKKSYLKVFFFLNFPLAHCSKRCATSLLFTTISTNQIKCLLIDTLQYQPIKSSVCYLIQVVGLSRQFWSYGHKWSTHRPCPLLEGKNNGV